MKWRPVDIIVLIIVMIIGISILFAQVKHLFIDNVLPEDAVKQLSHIITGLVAIVSLYVGSKLGKKNE